VKIFENFKSKRIQTWFHVNSPWQSKHAATSAGPPGPLDTADCLTARQMFLLCLDYQVRAQQQPENWIVGQGRRLLLFFFAFSTVEIAFFKMNSSRLEYIVARKSISWDSTSVAASAARLASTAAFSSAIL
jgi:hypothetical protein